ncbi:energy-coupling factor ABC transporter ATP-binding protein [Dictyoglomus thermophilum]|uniref:ABC transporter, ATP-binding protein n=3 Tax=Dictyoglomus thermophilum TaxID=14 RepID=B5YAJ6_DICT6|nr:ABC transporter ATP-binding protein [Dictyoglomus thermophilum]ACI20090.1 ABC transporter, ATP-binding protein [Dictyoglomus thermophilum H-6-12]MCX7720522.1 energy-coupling factor ABC transporter ATP-binding protein [Dictyoglomus thermophilum]
MDRSKILFKLVDVSFYYVPERVALNSVSIEVKEGESIGILGPNGSGKSTLLKILDGLLFPQRGKIFFEGKELTEKNFEDPSFNRYFRRKVVLLFQNVDAMLFSPTVRDELAFGLFQIGYSDSEIENKIMECSRKFRIEKLLNRSPFQLSEGEKKKVALASLLIIDPDVILLDEPTNELDPRSVRELLSYIKELRTAGKTIVTATHDLQMVNGFFDRIFVMNEEKKIVKVGDYETIFSDREFLKEVNLI